MKIFTIQKAKKSLAALIKLACQGEEVVIAHEQKLFVRLIPIANVKSCRQPGVLRGKLRIGPDFFEPLLDEEITREK